MADASLQDQLSDAEARLARVAMCRAPITPTITAPAAPLPASQGSLL